MRVLRGCFWFSGVLNSRKEGRITSIISGRGVPVTEERFSIGLISGSRRAGDTYELTKNEVVLRLAENKEEQLKESKEWELYLSLTQFRVLKTMHLLLDVEHHLAITSKVLQKTNIAPTDMYNAFERLYEDLDLLKTVDGLALKEFASKFNEQTESFGGINLENMTEGDIQFKLDRDDAISSLIS